MTTLRQYPSRAWVLSPSAPCAPQLGGIASRTALLGPKLKGKLTNRKRLDAGLARCSSVQVGAPEADVDSRRAEVKERNVVVVPLTKDTLTLRGQSIERFKFEVEYGLQVGTTDNAYVVQGPKGAALIDVPDDAFAPAFVHQLAGSLDLRDLQFLVLGHLSPKRVQSFVQVAQKVIEAGGEAPLRVLCSNPAYQTLSAALPAELTSSSRLDLSVVKPGDSLDLGDGHVLEFILTPTPRWPDGMVTYDPASKLIFTHKLFSAHVCREDAYDFGGWDMYGEHWRFFYDCMLAPAPKQVDAVLQRLPISTLFAPPSYAGKSGIGVLKADLGLIWSSVLSFLNLDLEAAAALSPAKTGSGGARTSSLPVSAICPMHGPLVRSSLTELVREYKEWTREGIRRAEEATVAVLFASAYGNTSAMAQAVSRGLLRGGVGVESVNCEQSSKEEVVAVVQRSSGFAIGSPTLGGHMPTPIQEALGVLLQDPTARSKPAGVFGSFGWSGEAVDEIEKRLKDAGFGLSFPSIRCKFKPTEAMIQVCEESGRDLAREVRRRVAKSRALDVSTAPPAAVATASGAAQAVGRVVGSLCVLSAVKGDAESAMLASWVSQASFNPPGISVAVAKERAVASLVMPGAAFALSVLGEGRVGPISKQLLKPFAPGEPRFGDLKVRKASNGATVLDDAIAYLECTVESRMETGDHWVLYATVNTGNILDEKIPTAIHHRKIGTRY